MRKKRKRGTAASPGKVFCLSAKQAQAALAAQPLVHLDCRGRLQVENCRGILLYSENAIELDMGAAQVRIEGDGLVMDTYQKAYITLHGRIFSVRLSEKASEKASEKTRRKP